MQSKGITLCPAVNDKPRKSEGAKSWCYLLLLRHRGSTLKSSVVAAAVEQFFLAGVSRVPAVWGCFAAEMGQEERIGTRYE